MNETKNVDRTSAAGVRPQTTSYRHVLLYAKLHYAQGNVIEDLRKIMCVRAGLDPEFMSDEDIWRQMVSIAMEFLSKRELEVILSKMFDTGWEEDVPMYSKGRYDGTSNLRRGIMLILSPLAHTTVYDGDKLLIDLGEADPNILPLSEERKKQIAKALDVSLDHVS